MTSLARLVIIGLEGDPCNAPFMGLTGHMLGPAPPWGPERGLSSTVRGIGGRAGQEAGPRDTCVLQDTLEMCTKEMEFKCILFALCYFHAVVAERRKFGAQGWNRSYPFNNGDLTISINVLYNYLEANPKVWGSGGRRAPDWALCWARPVFVPQAWGCLGPMQGLGKYWAVGI